MDKSLEKILKYTYFKWIKMHVNYPPRSEKILKLTDAKGVGGRWGVQFKIF